MGICAQEIEDPSSDFSSIRRLFWSLLGVDSGLFAHGGEDDDVYGLLVSPHDLRMYVLTGVLAVFLEELLDLVTDITIWNLDIVLGGAVVVHEGEETVVSDIELVHVSIPYYCSSVSPT